MPVKQPTQQGQPLLLYKTSSFTAEVVAMLQRMAAAAAIVYLFTIFDENPFVIGGLMVVPAWILLLSGGEQLRLYQDRLERQSSSLWAIIFRQKPIVILWLKGITDCSFTDLTKSPSSLGEIAIAAPILLYLNRNRRYQRDYDNYLYVYKGMQKEVIVTRISEAELTIIMQLILTKGWR